ncbi:amino acid permease [Falsarthrobacter nasiphocae]|uniref:GABA permease n=1 Tax=Falsarthrobacter nasiphocae TaxID=189863 RepID=A0AAE4C4Z0_9MICC|nr:amino acid permease [Falsarthrobacter nasiphocae]MDR6891816.1 GABA permease [Falsarthrobacter nasiphocae]
MSSVAPAELPAATGEPKEAQLAPGLKKRHISMISIAGVIGAGLFVGSSNAIAVAGPAVLISYALAGTLVVLVMRMLGEMAVANPDTGSFSTYADRALGRWAGFSVGWLYWWFWVLVIPFEAIAAGEIIAGWTGLPAVLPTLLVIALLVASNLISVKNYGEFEFWFALIKVVAIIAFIAMGVAAIFNLLPNQQSHGLAHLTSHGFMPAGVTAVATAMMTTMFSFMGTEIVTIAAAESKNPEAGITKATNSVIWRIGIFYIASIFIVVALVPYTYFDKTTNPDGLGTYGAALAAMGVTPEIARNLVNVIVLFSVASCLNSAVYTASRMSFSLSRRGDAPAAWSRVTKQGVPAVSVLVSTAVAVVAVVLNYTGAQSIFSVLLQTSGGIALLVYLVICFTQLASRRRLEAEGRIGAVRMWGFPYVTIGTIVAIIAICILMLTGSSRMDFVYSAILAAITIAAGVVVQKRSGNRHGATDVTVPGGH